MNFFHKHISSSLRNKLLISTVILVVVISGSVLTVVSVEVQNLTNARLQQDFTNTYQTFKRFLTLRNERLVESCQLISDVPVLKAQLSTKDAPTIRDYILSREESPAKLTEVDIFTLTDEKGKVLFRLDRPEKNGDTIAALPFIKKALEGKDPQKDRISFWIIDEKLYQIVTVPIFQNFIIGTLTLGKRITRKEAFSLKEDTQSDITFILGNNIVASTHSDIAQVDLFRSYLVHRGSLDRQMNADVSIQQEALLDGERFLCAFSRASKESEAVYVMAVSLDEAMAEHRKFQTIILLVGALVLMLAIAGAFIMAERITAPLRNLVVGTKEILAGNYNFGLHLTSNDEIGQLAHSFNDMVIGLRERFLMSKFISSSTVQMIQQESGALKLGGERRNVTVLFSDIRGFTSFSERVEPEAVIELLNNYLSNQESVVMKYHGVIDKYVGDELIAVFEGEDMVDNAVLCAVEIQKVISVLNTSNPEDIRVGIGINTGMAIVGNVGSEHRMDHTVLGNNINIGSRLCALAEAGQVIISESSSRLLKCKDIHLMPLEVISVKGISRPVQTYQVLM